MPEPTRDKESAIPKRCGVCPHYLDRTFKCGLADRPAPLNLLPRWCPIVEEIRSSAETCDAEIEALARDLFIKNCARWQAEHDMTPDQSASDAFGFARDFFMFRDAWRERRGEG